ncbi:hypothetical protein LTR66_012486 [Elasticomyces elasticus]|nr:hypothetical protein LTR66_012486 [Elasticomyces elasticus]
MGGVMVVATQQELKRHAGAQVPIFDISLHYTSSDPLHSLLVNNTHLGAALAAGFTPSSSTLLSKTTSLAKSYLSSTPSAPPPFPAHTTILMRGHGFTCVGSSIQEAVYRAIYTCTNARIQTTALTLQNGANVMAMGEAMSRKRDWMTENRDMGLKGIRYLDDRECADTAEASKEHAERPWKLWCKEVEDSGFYTNEVEAAKKEPVGE